MALPENLESMREDVAFLRAIVLDGGRSGVGDGFGLIAAGTCYGVAGLASFVVASSPGIVPMSVAGIFEWASAALVAVQVAKRLTGGGQSRDSTPVARFADSTRWGLGLAILTVAVAFAVANGFNGALLQPFISVVVFAVYGAIWVAIASVTSAQWPRGVAAASYAVAVLLARLAGSKWQFLAFGLAMLALGLLPGLWIRRQVRP